MKQPEKALRSYYKRQMHHGRSVLARGVDYVALRLLFFCACYLWFNHMAHNRLLAVFLSVICLLILSVALHLAAAMRLERFVAKERERIWQQFLQEQLTLLPREDFLLLCREHLGTLPSWKVEQNRVFLQEQPALVYALQNNDPPAPSALLPVCRAARTKGITVAAIFSAAPFPAKTQTFAGRQSDPKLYLFAPETLLPLMDATPENREAAIDGLILSQLEQERLARKERVRSPLAAGRAKRYFWAAAVLLLASFFTAYALYYRLMSGLCVLLGSANLWLNRNQGSGATPEEPAV